MHNGDYRINGGLGFAISEPSCNLFFSSATEVGIQDQRIKPFATGEQQRLEALLRVEQKRRNFHSALQIQISGNMYPHMGFGSGTSITLACLEALHELNGSKPSIDELIAASGRGGTSGVGIHSYFSGGYVFDLGRLIDRSPHTPSHQATSFNLPLVIDHGIMPDWQIGICIPLSIPSKSQTEEREFFQRTCPLPKKAVYETIYHVLFGLYAAIRESDRVAFCRAVQAVQSCAWKKAERLEYGNALIDIEQTLYAKGADAVGMSSLGPSLFFLSNDVSSLAQQMRLTRPDCEWLETYPVNQGRTITHA